MISDIITAEEKDIYRAIMLEKICNEVIVNESGTIPETCEKIRSRPQPDMPVLIFTSDGTELDVPGWVEIEKDYAAELENSRVVELDCGHYIHNIEQDRISAEIRDLIVKLDS